MRIARRESKRARIEIIPMIDTVFFLLVFFMMASLAMTMYRGMSVNLPAAASGQATRDDKAAITLDRDGRMFLNREPTTRDTLAGQLRTLVSANPNLVVMINADGEVLHRRVVDVVDVARTAGINRLAIAVVPPEPPRRP
ncbi:MAG TPA: biopolymer transporter ExbD [Candidatus Acidoferrum sp.]|nr:biopolymer transporter ExbD [Candidatus Acidoferrum sp.]